MLIIRHTASAALLLLSLAACQTGSHSIWSGQVQGGGGRAVSQTAQNAVPPVKGAEPAPARAPAREEYRMGAGDIVSVRVYGGDEEIRLERIRLGDTGSIALPFGQFKAVGRTTGELEADIMKTVKGRILVNPRVWVNVDEYRPFFVEGQVGRPGAYPYQPGLNIRKAISLAGGFGPRASMNKIFVVYEQDKSNTPVRVDLNARVGPGDTVTVQESFF